MKIINTCDKIKTLFPNDFDIAVWRRYASEISKELPQKCESDAKEYDFEKQVLPVLEQALNTERIDFVNNNFQAVIETLNENLTKLFDEEPDINIVLYLGLCNGAGWATTLDGKSTVLLGIEKIIELDWDDETNMRALILHEIGHLWHKLNGKLYLPDFTKRRKGIQHLYQEGVAMVCEHILCGDNNFYHQNKDGWLDWCRENESEIKKEYLRRLDKKESVQDFFGDWCSYNGHSDVGYYLGCKFVEYLMKTYTLKEVANLPYRKLNKAFAAFVKLKSGTEYFISEAAVKDICSWKYPPPYNVYNCEYDEVSGSMLEEEKCKNYLCFWENDTLNAYINIYCKNDKFFLGIGLSPEKCGKKLGKVYLLQGISEAKKRYPNKTIWVQVRSWNQRAIKCYKSCGFKKQYKDIEKDRHGKDEEFVFMCLQEKE